MKIYQVDAFTDKLFGGNPAAVCPLSYWPDDDLLQNIAAENNLAETAFFVPSHEYFELRWFTPTTEVDLCGHATLASAYVLFHQLNYQEEIIQFHTRSGLLTVSRLKDNRLLMDFPSDTLSSIEDKEVHNLVNDGINSRIKELWKGKDDYLAVVDSPQVIEQLAPDFRTLARLDSRGIIVTAEADKDVTPDFVSRCFFPQSGVDEDPTTGSGHTTLTPYWTFRLKKNRMQARQLSSRIGNLECIYKGNRTALIGNAVLYMAGEIKIQHKI